MAIKTDFQQYSTYFENDYLVNGNLLVSSATPMRRTWVDSRDGGDFPSWREYVRAKKDATTHYVCSFQRAFPVRLDAAATVTKPNLSESWEMHGSPPEWLEAAADPAGMDISQAEQTARSQFIQHYRDARTAFQSGVFLGELKETVKMIVSPAKALRQAVADYHAALKKRSHSGKLPVGAVADSWLEFQFGVKPLWNDVLDASRIGCLDPHRVFENLSAKGVALIAADTSKAGRRYGSLGVSWTRRVSAEAEVKLKGAIGYQNEPPSFPEQLGLSWSNVLPTAWELLPWSFLIDYFTNVGKVVDGISTGRINLRWGCRLVWQTVRIKYTAVELDQAFLSANTPANAKSSGFASGGGEGCSRSIFTRSILGDVSFGLGDLHCKLPGSDTRWTNIGALAAARVSDRARFF